MGDLVGALKEGGYNVNSDSGDNMRDGVWLLIFKHWASPREATLKKEGSSVAFLELQPTEVGCMNRKNALGPCSDPKPQMHPMFLSS